MDKLKRREIFPTEIKNHTFFRNWFRQTRLSRNFRKNFDFLSLALYFGSSTHPLPFRPVCFPIIFPFYTFFFSHFFLFSLFYQNPKSGCVLRLRLLPSLIWYVHNIRFCRLHNEIHDLQQTGCLSFVLFIASQEADVVINYRDAFNLSHLS